MTEKEILELIQNDPWMMTALKAARSLSLPDWMIGAGFVRNKVWDHLHGYETKASSASDVDLIYFDKTNLSEDKDARLSEKLKRKTGTEWEVINQAYTHSWHNREHPYENTTAALAEWVETPTCVAVRLENDDTLTFFAPHGIDDLVNLVVRPTPMLTDDLDTFWGRVKGKKWEEKWPKLKIVV